VDKQGKERPWRKKKAGSLAVADSFERIGKEAKAGRMRECGDYLVFSIDEDGGKKLRIASFCQQRLCVMCSWMRSRKVFAQVSRVMDAVDEAGGYEALFLTLTLRNCEGDGLADALDIIFGAWNKIWCNKRLKRIYAGWFRALEVTYSKKDGTYHPHVHAVLVVEKGYFKGKDYMCTRDWVALWRKALGLDYDPVCDVRKVKRDGSRKIVAEVAKYTVKDTEYVVKDKEKMDSIVAVLSDALHGRRLYAFGGLMKEVAKRIDAESLDIASDVREDISEMLVERYRWDYGLSNYFSMAKGEW